MKQNRSEERARDFAIIFNIRIREMEERKVEIAKILHAVIKAQNDFYGEETAEFDASNYDGLFSINENSKPEDSHNAWMEARIESGWVYGEKKDVEKKISPCLVPYEELPAEQRVKDYIAIALVKEFYLNQKVKGEIL